MEDKLKKVEDLQQIALNIYGKYNIDKSLLWMVEEVGEVIASIRKKHSKETVQEEIGDLIAWIFNICNILDITTK